MEADQKEKTIEDELYEALVIQYKKPRVMELCLDRQIKEGPLHKITIHKDTVLHMAVHTEQADLVLELVKALPENEGSRIIEAVNDGGNTILHEVAISDKLVGAAEEMLQKAPDLLGIKNKYNETALFRAVNFGQIKMFGFLDEKITKQFTDEKVREFHRTSDSKTKTTTLHVAILAAQFDLANLIANKHKDLIEELDHNGMTALQHLSRDETTFNNGGRFVRHFINSCISSLSTKDNIAGEGGVSTKDNTAGEEDSPCWRLPWWEAVRKKHKKYDSALKLAKLLIERDTSWKKTEEDKKNGENCLGRESSSSSEPLHEDNKKDQKNDDHKRTPLLLATKYGCEEIVDLILARFPRAIEHVDDKGRTILHKAIKHRQIAIFDMIYNMDIPMKRLVRKCDKKSNSILHMAGKRAKRCKSDDTLSPVLQLQMEWQLFERVQNMCSAHFFRYINSENKTAEQLFAETNATLRGKAEEWLKNTAQNSSIVAVLIATVAFAAAYTIPGGFAEPKSTANLTQDQAKALKENIQGMLGPLTKFKREFPTPFFQES
ncbi:hypothetical protein F0562_008393 [Nyssa sinensis]|uniref:PGG domain-containing protein n=1 Tax=Nyssa sinensis TaxID=561372 RepID=A0A5J5A848_9ASTE|nr:hypothetical protein F0562_008393 [Nyssa sinensis]